MSWPTAPLASVAPRQIENLPQRVAQNLWHPKPSHIESKTGQILRKEYVSRENLPSPFFYFNKGDILLRKFNPVSGKAVITDEAGIVDNQWIVLQPDAQVIDPQFLAHYLRSPLFKHQAEQHTIGTVMPRISEKWLNTHPIPLPPLAEQCRIVVMLDKTRRLLQLQATTNRNAQTVLRAQYLNMFGDPASNPLHLKKVRLLDLLEMEIGKPLKESDLSPDGIYPIYGASTSLRRTDQWLCEANTIIIARTGPRCGAVRYAQEKAWVTAHAMFARKKHPELEDRYLVTALELAELGKIGGSAKVPVLSIQPVAATEILLPEHSQQQKFAHFAERITAIAQLQTAAGKQLTALWVKLQDQAFSGQLSAKAHNLNPLHNNMKDDSL